MKDHFDHIVDVALRVDAAGNREANQIHFGRGSEHQRADGDENALRLVFSRHWPFFCPRLKPRWAGALFGMIFAMTGAFAGIMAPTTMKSE
jgi:hypothetical protein